jgi:hypothetical protein
MKRFARWGLGLVLVVVVRGIGVLFWLDSIARSAVERGGTHALGVETSLEDASIGVLSSKFALTDLDVANPAGFAGPSFLSMRSARLELPLRQLLEPRVTIPALELEGITIHLERGANGTNFGQILDHLSRFESGSGNPPDEAKEGESKTFHLQRLVIRDVRASVQLIPSGGELTQLEVAVPEIAVDDLASDMTIAQICGVVVKVVLRAGLEAGKGKIPEELLADLRARVEDLEAQARGRIARELGGLEEKLEEQAKKLGPEAERALQKASEELGGKLDDLLNKKKK